MGNSYSKFNNNSKEAEIKTFGDINLRSIIFSYLKDPPPPNFDFGIQYGVDIAFESFKNWLIHLNNRGYRLSPADSLELFNKLTQEAHYSCDGSKWLRCGEAVNYPKNHWEKQKYITIDILRHIEYSRVLIHQELPYSWSISDT